MIRISAIFITFAFLAPLTAQTNQWCNLSPLNSTRADVEKMLGKPEKFFEEYGLYNTDIGEFSVWFSRGECINGVEGRQWRVPSGRMTALLFYPQKRLPLEAYVANIGDFKRAESPGGVSRYNYISRNEDVIYQTIKRGDSVEFVSAVSLEPGVSQQHLLCKETER